MPALRLPFARLRDFLEELGFVQSVVPRRHIRFHHEGADWDFFLPIYRTNQIVAPHDLVMFRTQLDARDILDADEFGRRLMADAARHPA